MTLHHSAGQVVWNSTQISDRIQNRKILHLTCFYLYEG